MKEENGIDSYQAVDNNVNNTEPVVPQEPVQGIPGVPMPESTPQGPIVQPVAPQVQQVQENQVIETQPVTVNVEALPTNPLEATPAPVVEPPKRKSKLPIILIVIILLALGGYLCWMYLLPMIDKKEDNNTTTTSTTETTTTITEITTKVPEMLSIKSFDDYVSIVNNSVYEERSGVILLDNSFHKLDFALKDKCKNDGDKISFEDKGTKIEYTCEKDAENSTAEETAWVAEVNINGTNKVNSMTGSSCESWYNYTDNKSYIKVTQGCSIGDSYFKVENSSKTKLFDGKYEPYTITTYDGATTNQLKTPMLIKDSVLYFVEADKVASETKTICRVKYMRLDEANPQKVDMGVTKECYYIESIER